MTNPKRGITCYYWADGNRCKFSPEQCTYAHHDTGTVAQAPRTLAKNGANRKHVPDDLISLTSDKVDLRRNKPTTSTGYGFNGQAALSAPPEHPADPPIAGTLRTSISKGKDFVSIKNLLLSESPSAVKESLSLSKHAVAAIFAAVDKGRMDILRLIINHGVDPNARHSHSGIPVLASAIFQNNASAVVAVTILLETGSDPFVIPLDMWNDGSISLESSVYKDASLKTRWCDDANRNLLAKCLNLTIKHSLNEAAKRLSRGMDRLQSDNLVNVEDSNHLLIGQRVALNRVNQYLRCHWLCGKKEPLVLAFVGPAGHGKTELARRIGSIHQLGLVSAATSQTATPSIADGEDDLTDVQEKLLSSPANEVDVTWIDSAEEAKAFLLTSALDGAGNYESNSPRKVFIISITEKESTADFYYHLKSALYDAPDPEDLLETQDFAMRKQLIRLYGPSIAGRVACIVPFLPFSKKETTLLTHKLILDAAEALTNSCLSIPGPNCGKNVGFTVDADLAVCEHIGQNSYDVSLGVRSIDQAVLRQVKLKMVEEYAKAYLTTTTTMHPTEKTRVTTYRPLNFVIRLDSNKSVSVALE